MINVVIGIDIGTTYTKVSVYDNAGRELFSDRQKSVQFRKNNCIDPVFAAHTFLRVKDFLSRVVERCIENSWHPQCLALLAISPVIVTFCADNPEKAVAIPYWSHEAIDSGSTGIERTVRRIHAIEKHSKINGMKASVTVELIGYLIYRLTKQLTLNTVSAGEMGLENSSDWKLLTTAYSKYEVKVLSPIKICGDAMLKRLRGHSPVPVAVGCTDSFGSALASQSIEPGNLNIYLGTFGSLLKVMHKFSDVLREDTSTPILPYEWVLSVPRFGKFVEAFAHGYGVSQTMEEQFQKMELDALNAPPGARGLLLRLPTLDNLGKEVGEYKFINITKTQVCHSLKARAIFESLGHLINVRGHCKCDVTRIGLSGGGAISSVWSQILSGVLGRKLVKSAGPAGANSAALLSALSIGWHLDVEFIEVENTAAKSEDILKTTKLADRYY